jgi:osmotically-inducible protein OsmY
MVRAKGGVELILRKAVVRRMPRLVRRSTQETPVKTDTELKQDVEAELSFDPAVKSDAIGVAVRDGVVTLTGHLATYAEKWAAEKALRRVDGVKAIALELDVRLSPAHQRSDTEIAQAARMALKWHSLVPVDAVHLTVDKGWIRLEGQVDWDFQRRSVEKAVRDLKGVVGLSNEISLKPRPAPADVARRIQNALVRQAVREAQHLEIDVKEGRVTLRGNVHSWHERDAAQGAAWAAPGVRAVVNELRVGG